jgi:hypothetical protein
MVSLLPCLTLRFDFSAPLDGLRHSVSVEWDLQDASVTLPALVALDSSSAQAAFIAQRILELQDELVLIKQRLDGLIETK